MTQLRGSLDYGIRTSKQRTSAYPGRGSSHDTYEPLPNKGLVFPIGPVGVVGDEYLRISDEVASDAAPTEVPRNLYVVTDTILEMNNLMAELRGDSLFVFNALATARGIPKKGSDIRQYGNGFRAHYESHASLSTHFLRAMNALDAWSREVTDRDLVHRTDFGTGKKPLLMMQPDIKIIDQRNR